MWNVCLRYQGRTIKVDEGTDESRRRIRNDFQYKAIINYDGPY